jgi:uncharacterized protein
MRAWLDRRARRQQRLAELFRFWTPGGPRVRDLIDPVALGVTPAAALNDAAEQVAEAGIPPPYVRRTADAALDRALESAPFVVLVGGSKAGKSRSAFEALRRHFAGRVLLAPASKASFPALLELGVPLPAVVWLDELDQYLGTDGLSVHMLERLLDAGSGALTLIGTIRARRYARFQEYEGDTLPQGDTLPERMVLQRAAVIKMELRLDADERARVVGQGANPRIAAALMQLDRYGLAEYLAAGPALLDRWLTGRSVEVCPVGVAIVQTAIDWRRAGCYQPIPLPVLESVYPLYLDDFVLTHRKAEAFTEGLAWATNRIFATAALLEETTAGYVAFDYLVDYVERQDPSHFPIADEMWQSALEATANSPEALNVAAAAYDTDREDIEERALRQAVAAEGSNVSEAAYHLGTLLGKRGELGEAEIWYRKAVDGGMIWAPMNFGNLLAEHGRPDEAAAWFREAFEGGVREAAVNLAGLLVEQGRPEEAEIWYLKAINAGFLEPIINLASLLASQGRLEEAETWLRIGIDDGDPEAEFQLGNLLDSQGRLSEAEDLYRAAIDHGALFARSKLVAFLWKQGRVDEAKTWMQKIIDLRNPFEIISVGRQLDDQGRSSEAEAWFRRAIEDDISGIGYDLGLLLERQGRLDEAEIWYRRAIDEGDLGAAEELARLLRQRGRQDGPRSDSDM